MIAFTRRLRHFLAGGLAVALAWGGLQAEPPPPGLSVREGRFHLAGQPYRGVGANYYDLFTRLVAKPGDASSVDGLRALARAGVPFVRFNAGGYQAREWQRYLADPAAHFAAMDRVVRTAEEAGIGLIPSVFWNTALSQAAGERREAWGNPESRTIVLMRDYASAIARRYHASPAIWAWEFGNEWNLSADLPNAAERRHPGEDERDDLRSAHVTVALAEFAAAIRAIDATRPLITGHSHPRAQAWHNTHENSWGSDTEEQWRKVMARDNPRAFDTVGIHIYADSEANAACGRWTTGWPDYLGKLRAFADQTRRPIFIGEFGLADGGKFSPVQVKTRYRDILGAMEAAGVDLAAFWVFDLAAQAKDWNVTFDNARAYMLEDSVAAHRRWQAPAALPSRPNVLVIISDDQGFSDFGFTGNKLVRTPHLDRLAAESAVFENFVTAPACAPSRAAFYTGRMHLGTGVWGVPPRANLHDDEGLMAGFFRGSGYRTFYAGKSGMALLRGNQTWDRGWDEGWFVRGYTHHDPTFITRDGSIKKNGWTAELTTDLILDFWRRHPGQPTLAIAAYIIPHLPWVCADNYAEPFRRQGLSDDLCQLYGSIAQMDAAIGRLLEGLRESGRDKDTIIVFVSDNGMTQNNNGALRGNATEEISAEDWKKRNLHGLRGQKTMVWENGIRVPMLVRWPDRVAAGKRAQFGAAEDILPTLLDLAGIAPSAIPHQPFDGVSLRPSLENSAVAQPRPDIFRIAIARAGAPKDLPPGTPRHYEDHHLSLRGQRYKFHALPGGKQALYDIIADPAERNDLAGARAEITSRMAADCRARWDALLATGRAFLPPPPGASRKDE